MQNIALQNIEQTCRMFFPECEIILFGSRARNDFLADSDYDFLIITPRELSVEKKRLYKAKIRRILAKQQIPVDVIIQSKRETAIKQKITGHIIKQALNEGVAL